VSARGARVIDGALHRVGHGRQKRFVASPPAGPQHRPARVAVTLAHAHKIRQAILSGEIQDQADAARKLGLTRARLSQVIDLTNLAPDLQEEILFLETIDGREPLSERALRGVFRVTAWDEQRLNDPLHRSSTQPALPVRHPDLAVELRRACRRGAGQGTRPSRPASRAGRSCRAAPCPA
jgi:hypothetical protein